VPVPVTTFAPLATGGTAQQPITSFNYQNIGVNIDITPRTHHDDDVSLNLKIAVTNISGTGFGGLQPTIVLSAHPEPTPGLLRLHFDVSPVGGDQDAELARLLAAGARPADVGQRGDEGWHVLADPEGNEFCLLRRQLET